MLVCNCPDFDNLCPALFSSCLCFPWCEYLVSVDS